MFKHFFSFEVKFWLRGWMVWIFFLIVGLLFFGAVSCDQITVGNTLGNTYKNAPWVIENFYAVCSILTLLMTTAFVNSAASRDFACNMHQIVFSDAAQEIRLPGGTVSGIGSGGGYPAAGSFGGNSGREVHALGRRGTLGACGVDGAPEGDSGFCHSQHAVHRGSHLCHRGSDQKHGSFVSRQPGAAGGIWSFPGAHHAI